MSSFAENLPGLPDNIRMAEDGTLWVGLAGIRRAGKMSFVDLLAPYNTVRQVLVDVEYHLKLKKRRNLVVSW